MKDAVDALMGQTLGRISVFPWNNYPIINPQTGEEIGRIIDNRQWYKHDWKQMFTHRFGGSWKDSTDDSKPSQ
jgi:hypothetical protein